MPGSVKAKPDEYATLTPYLSVRGAADAIEFYKKAFGAQERGRMLGPDGKVAHAELVIGDSVLMLSDESPEMGSTSPQALGGSPVTFVLYVDDVDKAFPRALAAGGTQLSPVETMFYGDRAGSLTDPFGHRWMLQTHVEDVSMEEMQRRMEAMASGAH
ncbi:MAG TPA: VOC family protein [Dehalococcoidia bacterium]|nr:VOC family protein [Dehalococcoidia bacterium]